MIELHPTPSTVFSSGFFSKSTAEVRCCGEGSGSGIQAMGEHHSGGVDDGYGTGRGYGFGRGAGDGYGDARGLGCVTGMGGGAGWSQYWEEGVCWLDGEFPERTFPPTTADYYSDPIKLPPGFDTARSKYRELVQALVRRS